MELLERRTVSRKTPGDGRLEISPAAADRLRAGAPALEVEYDGRRAPGRVESMECTCQKATGAHEHHFVASELLKDLRASIEVELLVEHAASAPGSRLHLAVRPVE